MPAAFLFIFTLSLTLSTYAQTTELKLPTDIYQNNEEIFQSHQGDGAFDNTLAMTVKYGPIKDLRAQLESALNVKLDYFKAWNPDGEAHITVITPVEFHTVLKNKLTMNEIEAIAQRYDLQDSRLSLMGLGSARIKLNGKDEETYFVIADSYDLRNIRHQIFYEFTRRGGDRAAFDPTWYFPHITIGYTKRDLHEADGILKNLKFSHDSRFRLKIR